MRKYSEETKRDLLEMTCNKCGKKMNVNNGIVDQGVLNITYGWGYFSKKDGETHSFDICEECYDQLIKTFLIPIDIEERNEIV